MILSLCCHHHCSCCCSADKVARLPEAKSLIQGHWLTGQGLGTVWPALSLPPGASPSPCLSQSLHVLMSHPPVYPQAPHETAGSVLSSPWNSSQGHPCSHMDTGTPGPKRAYVFIPQIIRGTDKIKLPVDGHPADRAVSLCGL